MVVKTNKNEQVTADLVICCTGSKINSEAYRSSLSKCFLHVINGLIVAFVEIMWRFMLLR